MQNFSSIYRTSSQRTYHVISRVDCQPFREIDSERTAFAFKTRQELDAFVSKLMRIQALEELVREFQCKLN